jgi:hypothetical protein
MDNRLNANVPSLALLSLSHRGSRRNMAVWHLQRSVVTLLSMSKIYC